MRIEILMSPSCGHGERTRELLVEILHESGVDVGVQTTVVVTDAEAARLKFPGSPTVRIDGVDIESEVPTRFGVG